jgi:CRP/FNR family cyclic AMP-dependent transcriptional regulator
MASNQLFEKYGRTVSPGTFIFREDDEGDRMFIIQEGKVRITKNIAGKEHILTVLEKGDFFGEMAIVTNTRRTASATAVGEVSLLAFDRQGFLSMIEKNAKIALNIIDKLCRRLQHANLQIQHLKKKNEKSLVALNLLYAFTEKEKDDPRIPFDRTIEEIALNLEVPPKTVLSVIEDLVRVRILAVDANTINLIDKDRLASAAETMS